MTNWSHIDGRPAATFDPETLRGQWLGWPTVSGRGIHLWLATFLVHIKWVFFLSVAFAAISVGRSAIETAIWVVAALVAIVIHELGHAVAAVWQGGNARIELNALGGLTFPTGRSGRDWRERIAISAAGPGLGMVVGGTIWLSLRFFDVSLSPLIHLAVSDFVWILVAWNLVNLLPILPLDGGNIAQNLMAGSWAKPDARQRACVLSIYTALIAAAFAFRFGNTFTALCACAMAYSNYQEIRDRLRFRFF